ncbi:extracellular catalytic domain type 1 short-chain-length polyhydroxyalkanoate depolymerase [Catenuloplanes atrovinosus]|uniref:Poly(Hydroxyalkanoate) depolymerase family esterase n=1 Tax=Catenuloplanes atrovinosus TaxID=137266 RepID=A0AAE4CB70_9ACTN|nr:PHB depolymerase family esterase [Catenuloplanes atrovinosus]MDR7277752.1 poly(hydroxyalkanoate) depolymerase family esterase [Catenuloplanes atrovinosus]
MRTRLLAIASVVLVAVVTALGLPTPAAAAALTEVTSFGSNPSNLRMYLYVPDKLAAKPGLLVAVHYCTGTGPAFYNGSQFDELANQHGYIVIYPSVTRSSQCFDVASPAALRREGGSDPVGIKSMIDYVRARYPVDADKIVATGVSSGGMMTNVLLGVYPDVFSAGSAFAGVPFGCFATTNGSEWNSDCANGLITKTPQQWGDLVRNAYPGYSGRRPRMQTWHGTNDETLKYPNFGEQIKQWTNVHGLAQTPSYTDTPQSGYTRTRYGATGDQAPVEGISMAGVSHNLPVNAAAAIHFLGLDTTTPTSPSPTPTTPGPTPTTPQPTTPAPAGACQISYTINSWNTGFTASVAITNTGTATVNGWTLAFTLPSGQTVTNSWNATINPSSGALTARNVPYNGTLGAGATQTFGFQATHTGTATKPTAFSLNGSICTIA